MKPPGRRLYDSVSATLPPFYIQHLTSIPFSMVSKKYKNLCNCLDKTGRKKKPKQTIKKESGLGRREKKGQGQTLQLRKSPKLSHNLK